MVEVCEVSDIEVFCCRALVCIYGSEVFGCGCGVCGWVLDYGAELLKRRSGEGRDGDSKVWRDDVRRHLESWEVQCLLWREMEQRSGWEVNDDAEGWSGSM